MKSHTLKMAAYWRNSLADADLGRGCWNDPDLSSISLRPRTELMSSHLDSAVVDELFRTEDADMAFVEVVAYPLVYKLKVEHGVRKQYSLPSTITPVVVKAIVLRDGTILPSQKMFIARDLLEPLDKTSFAFGHIDDLDTFLTNQENPVPERLIQLATVAENTLDDFERAERSSLYVQLDSLWKQTQDYARQMLDAVNNKDTIRVYGYVKAREWALRKIGGANAPTKRISSLYDHMRQTEPETPLLDRLASLDKVDVQPLLPRGAEFDLHLGHCSNQFALACAQRDSLNHVLHLAPGEMLAVNGPPGTGKTTLLLTLIASEWVRAAIEQSQPPVIVATSTNNQAVTNVIDSLKKDIAQGSGPFAGRWISSVNSFGMYLSSRAKRQVNGTKYISADFFDDLEKPEKVAQARDDFLHYACEAFPDLYAPSVKTVVERLHECMLKEKSRLTAVKQTQESLDTLEAMANKGLGNNWWDSLQKIDDTVEEALKQFNVFETAYLKLVDHIGEQPFWYDLLSFLPSVSRKQGVRASIVVKRTLSSIPVDKVWNDVETLKTSLKQKVVRLKKQTEKLQRRQRRAHNVVQTIRQKRAQLYELYRTVADGSGPKGFIEPKTIHEASEIADTTVRFKLFQLATHYWEGRWLLEVDGREMELLKTRGCSKPESMTARWYRRMMLTPCAVSTLYMLPGAFRSLQDNDPHNHNYLYSFIDILIVDEAGQVLPEVSAAAFALAKKAVVVGDTLQIPPIWNVPKSVDIGNLVHHEILTADAGEQDMQFIQNTGITAFNGNLMTIAQQRSLFHYDVDLPKGMVLYEHRRCFNEIIAFCNAISYKNKLIPSRGRRQDLQMPPNAYQPLSYLNVVGQCRSKNTGTKFNTHEAETIAAWLKFNRNELERLYGMRLEDIVGIVTPFTGQVDAIKACCRKMGIDLSAEAGMTVGTIHSFQGAERKIIIFSPTYTVEHDGNFIDASPSMMNVAVSRAIDNFIVVGDMRTFNPKHSYTPRGLLATFLLRNEENRIFFDGKTS